QLAQLLDALGGGCGEFDELETVGAYGIVLIDLGHGVHPASLIVVVGGRPRSAARVDCPHHNPAKTLRQAAAPAPGRRIGPGFGKFSLRHPTATAALPNEPRMRNAFLPGWFGGL